MKLAKYRGVVFDCDGVVLNSNGLKSEVFYSVTSRYGSESAEALLAYHKANGGLSRYLKLQHLFGEILHRPPVEGEMESLLQEFSMRVREGLQKCEVAPGIAELRERTSGIPWMIASGADEVELREVLSERGIAKLFNAGIYGSPTPKQDILLDAVHRGTVNLPAIMFGDSRLDYECAKLAGLDFVFVHGWTDFEGWRTYFRGTPVTCVEHLGHI